MYIVYIYTFCILMVVSILLCLSIAKRMIIQTVLLSLNHSFALERSASTADRMLTYPLKV